MAREFLQGYKILAKEYPDTHYSSPNLGMAHVRYYLIGHSLELAFKSFLLDKGYDLNQLKCIGHDLTVCVKHSNEKGLHILNDKEQVTIKMLNAYYLIKDFEYPRMGSKTLPLWGDVVSIAEKVIKAAD
jgi:hypothetical protein